MTDDVSLGEVSRKVDALVARVDLGFADIRAEMGRYVARETHKIEMDEVRARLTKMEAGQARLVWAILSLIGAVVAGVAVAFLTGTVG